MVAYETPRARGAGWAHFRRFWAAHSVSSVGDQLTLVALPVATFAVTGSAIAVGVVASAEGATVVVFGIMAGALADRLPHRQVLAVTDLARAVLLLAVAVALVGDQRALPPLMVAAVGLGLLRVLHDAAAGAAVPMVVDGPDVLAANGRLNASEAAATAAGPSLAGVVLAVGGPALAFLVDGVTFLVSGLTVRGMRGLDEHGPPPTRTPILADVAEGLRALAADRPMVQATALAAALNVVAVAVEAHFIPFADRELGIGPLGIGLYFALGGSVAVATSIWVGRRSAARGAAIVAGLAVMAGGVLVAGAVPNLATTALAYIGAGLGSALVVAHLATLRQRRFPVALQGRLAMAGRTVTLGVMAIALLVGGWLSEATSPALLFVVVGSIGLAAAAWGALAGLTAVRTD